MFFVPFNFIQIQIGCRKTKTKKCQGKYGWMMGAGGHYLMGEYLEGIFIRRIQRCAKSQKEWILDGCVGSLPAAVNIQRENKIHLFWNIQN